MFIPWIGNDHTNPLTGGRAYTNLSGTPQYSPTDSFANTFASLLLSVGFATETTAARTLEPVIKPNYVDELYSFTMKQGEFTASKGSTIFPYTPQLGVNPFPGNYGMLSTLKYIPNASTKVKWGLIGLGSARLLDDLLGEKE